MAHSKRYLEARKMVEENKTYPLAEAVDLLKSMPKLKFDEMVEISGKLGADPKQSDQMVRGSVVLPHGTGKQTKVLVFCEPEKENDAKVTGADKYGLTTVPFVSSNFILDHTVQELLALAEGQYPNGGPREGLVFRPLEERHSNVLKGRMSFKVINNKFLLKHEE